MGTIRLNSENHVRRAFKRIVLVEAGLLGAISALAQILPLIQWQVWLAAFIWVGVLSAILVWRSTKPVHLPEELTLDAETVDGGVFVEVEETVGGLVARLGVREPFCIVVINQDVSELTV